MSMTNWKQIISKNFNTADFDSYCRSLNWTTWKPSLIVLHNTSEPCLAQRPNGFTLQHIQNFENFYRNQLNWSAGPHLFIDDKQIWVFTPLTVPGVHSPSWNKVAIGIEMLGDFETESFNSGRGLAVRKNTVVALAILCKVLKLDPDQIRLHREDPLTKHACPGKNVIRSEVIAEAREKMRINISHISLPGKVQH